MNIRTEREIRAIYGSQKDPASAVRKARATLKSIVSPWRYLRYRVQGKICIRGESGFVWIVRPSSILGVRCKKGHNHHLCQLYTGEGCPDGDRIVTYLMHIRRGIEGERELIETSGEPGSGPKPKCLMLPGADPAKYRGKTKNKNSGFIVETVTPRRFRRS